MDLSPVTWRKSRYSTQNGECVEVGFSSKASHSTQNGSCVEVARSLRADAVAVRDSKDPDGPRLAFTSAEWTAFTRRVKTGQLD